MIYLFLGCAKKSTTSKCVMSTDKIRFRIFSSSLAILKKAQPSVWEYDNTCIMTSSTTSKITFLSIFPFLILYFFLLIVILILRMIKTRKIITFFTIITTTSTSTCTTMIRTATFSTWWVYTYSLREVV